MVRIFLGRLVRLPEVDLFRSVGGVIKCIAFFLPLVGLGVPVDDCIIEHALHISICLEIRTCVSWMGDEKYPLHVLVIAADVACLSLCSGS